MKTPALIWSVSLLAALQSASAAPPVSARHGLSPVQARGRSFAQETCGGCHALAPYSSSSNPNAPPFPAIVNRQGLSARTLTVWLRGAHNYPAEMDFYLNDRQVDSLVAYMITLKDRNYKRPPD